MDQETLFRQNLAELVKVARRQGMYVSKEQVAQAFPEIASDETKLAFVYEYLQKSHISVGEQSGDEAELSDEDRDFLGEYLTQIAECAEVSEEEKKEIILSATAGSEDAKKRLLEIYLPDVAEIAKIYTGQGVYLEDLIGEGNIALMMAVDMLECNEDVAEVDGFVAGLVMSAMEQLIEANEKEQEADRKVLDMVNDIAKAAKELADEFRRKVTVAELVQEGKFSEEDIREAIRVTAGKIEDIETE